MTKNVALFFDGTWMRNELRGESNVHRLYNMARKFPPSQQVCHYLSGVGTDRVRYKEVNALRWRARIDDESLGPLAKLTRKVLGGISGFGISGKIKEAYAFLVENYDELQCDRVYLFGFSRGAFTARSLAAFVNEVGLLLRNRLYLVPEAYEVYRTGGGRDVLAKYLERKLGHPVGLGEKPIPVYLIGVWDTVSALGIPEPFHALSLNTSHHNVYALPKNVSHARHALALHELRELYPPTPWVKSEKKQDLQQVWFSGAHADVGGGYKEYGLSDFSLRWMADQSRSLLLLLDEAQIKIRPKLSELVHQEDRFPHTAFNFTHRKALRDLLDGPFNDEAASHSVHPSAVLRLLVVGTALPPYRFTEPINAQLAEVDCLTLRLAVRCALLAEEFPDPYNAQMVAETRERLVDAISSFDPDDPVSVDRVTNAIAISVFAEGLDTMTVIENILQDWFHNAAEKLLKDPLNVLDTRQWLTRMLKNLAAIAQSMPDGATRRHLLPLFNFWIMNLVIPGKI